jgi:hypothetical protein
MAVTAACLRRYPGMPREERDWRKRPRRLDWSQVLTVLLMVLVVCYLATVGAQCLNSFIDDAPPEQLQAQSRIVHLSALDAKP